MEWLENGKMMAAQSGNNGTQMTRVYLVYGIKTHVGNLVDWQFISVGYL